MASTEKGTSGRNQSTHADASGENNTDQQHHRRVAVDLTRALVGGLIGATITFLGSYVTGRISGMEALALLEAMLPTTRFMSSAVITGSATILALMLTMLTLSHSAQRQLKSIHYQRVRQIAWLDAIIFIGATIFLLLLNIPPGGAEKVPASWFNIIYYSILGVASLLGGGLISVVLMLYHAVTNIIDVLDPETGDPVLVADESEET